MWSQTRRTVESTVKQAAETTVALAQQVLPKTLPRIVPPFAAAPVSGTEEVGRESGEEGLGRTQAARREARREVSPEVVNAS